MTPPADGAAPKVLVKEKIGESGVELLRSAGFEVELGEAWEDGELERRIGEFDGLLIRSATKVTADLIARAERLRAVGRAGVGWTTWTWTQPRGAASWWPTRRNPT